ncbi:MAG: nuclear transport factor 2 family protein [Myxococcota bacterium]|nr:nuclear transport factor 2 family protein [Myxococcota bacterium]
MQTNDEQILLDLHERFMRACDVGDTEFLRTHVRGGASGLTWFNLNKANYFGIDHICSLWDQLRAAGESASGQTGKGILNDDRDVRVEVCGDAAWLVYGLHLKADFGELGSVDHQCRTTEIWRRADGEWKLVHFHCSDWEPGWGGL